MLAIDLLLELLNKRKSWHDIDEISLKVPLPKQKTLALIDFLARYGFITLNKHGQKATIANDTHEFLKEIRQEERRNSIQGVKRPSPRRALKLL